MKLFIAIPCYAARESLDHTRAAFQARTRTPFTLETVIKPQSVVDNRNELLTLARNSGAEYVCFSDDDVEVPDGWDESLLGGIETWSTLLSRPVGQTGPLLLYPDGSVFSAWTNTLFDGAGGASITAVGHGGPAADVYRAVLPCPAVAGTVSVFTRRVLDAMGWRFDSRYPKSQYEDVDQSLTVRHLGYSVLYNGTVAAVHHATAQAPRATAKNLYLLIEKWKAHPELSGEILPGRTDEIRRLQEQLEAHRQVIRGYAESFNYRLGAALTYPLRLLTGRR